jgi:hypothetical protein
MKLKKKKKTLFNCSNLDASLLIYYRFLKKIREIVLI